LAIESSSIPSHALIITDASIKNNIATSILHTHIDNKPITKTLHHAVNIMSTEAKLFVIRCGINQATNSNNVSKIIIVTDSIYAAKKIFDLTFHPFQSHAVSIFNKFQSFFSHHQENVIEFWECPSHSNWPLHKAVDKEIKSFSPISLFSCKLSWNFSKKKECDDITNRWRIIFQTSDLKEKHFLNLINSDNNIIELLYIKGSLWLKFFGHSNSLCTRVSKAITNHAPTSEYRLKFFPREEFSYPCGLYPIETRCYILHECKRFNEY